MKFDRQTFSGRQRFNTIVSKAKLIRRKFAKDDGTEGETVTLQGYPILYDGSVSDDRGGYVVKLAPGSATFSAPTHALFHHQFTAPLGNTGNKTLRILPADATGVPVEIDLNMGTTVGRDVAAWVDRGDVTGMSFSMANGFEAYTEEVSDDEDQPDTITVNKFTCDEVTVTAIPAFVGTSIGIKPPTTKQDAAQYPARVAASNKLRAGRLQLAAFGRRLK